MEGTILSPGKERRGCSLATEALAMGRKPGAGTHLREEETKAGETRSRQEAVGKIPEGSRM